MEWAPQLTGMQCKKYANGNGHSFFAKGLFPIQSIYRITKVSGYALHLL
jgi:hypothetical protein